MNCIHIYYGMEPKCELVYFQIKMSIYISNYNIQKRNNEIDYVNRCIHYINISINHHCAYLNII